MKKKLAPILLITLIFSFFSSSLYSQTKPIKCVHDAIEIPHKTNKHCVIIFIMPGCSFCKSAIQDIGEWSKEKSVNLHIINLLPTSNLSEGWIKYINTIGANYISSESDCYDKLTKKIIPRIFIYDQEKNKIVGSIKGWEKKLLTKLDNKITD